MLSTFPIGVVVFFPVVLSALAAESPRVPTGDALAKAQASVEIVFGNDIKQAVAPGAKSVVARRMLKTAGEEKDSTLQYAILLRARDIAVDAGNAALGYEITTNLARFAPPGSGNLDGWAWIAQGDDLRQKAREEAGRRERLRTQLLAAECYLRSEPNATGLTKELIDKKIMDLAVDVVGKRNADLLILPGTWDVQVDKWRGTWTFNPDGTVTDGTRQGTWVARAKQVDIIWGEKTVDTFARPLAAWGVVGNSTAGPGTVQAKKQ